MCLWSNPDTTKEWQSKHRAGNDARVYKVVRRIKRADGSFMLISPLRHLDGYFEYKVGVNESDADPNIKPIMLRDWKIINQGIHVFLKWDMANLAVSCWGNDKGDCVVVPVWVSPLELLGVNQSEAAFLSVRLEQKDYEEALKCV